MLIEFQGKTVANLRLSGSVNAVNEMLSCQKTFNAAAKVDSNPKTHDPFANPAGSIAPADPFRQ